MSNKARSGYPCPKCGAHSSVYNTRQLSSTEGWVTKRYRLCPECKHKFPTVELLVIKDEKEEREEE